MFESSVYIMYHIKIIGCETSSSLLKSTLLLLCVVSFFFPIEFLQWITTEWVTLLISSHLFSYKISCLQMKWHILKKKAFLLAVTYHFTTLKANNFVPAFSTIFSTINEVILMCFEKFCKSWLFIFTKVPTYTF